ncbi:MAG TPA: patatin-like phospholipase family protein, partial [Leptospiraceae bacterium]|nr:patatin-like phospholipase family protein [Leptospiraceae bacterium]
LMLFFEKKPEYKVCFAAAGGGCRAFYAMGFGYALRTFGVRFEGMSGVSAGSAMILGILSETEEKSVEYIASLTKRNEKNFSLRRLLKGDRPFPHENIYRRTIRYGMDFNKITGSNVKVYIQAVLALLKQEGITDLINKAKIIAKTGQAYLLDEADRMKGLPGNRVEKLAKEWNFREVIYTNEHLKDPEIMEQIILNSSSIPPIVTFQNVENEYYFDGGLFNNLLLEVFPLESRKIGIYYDDTSVFGKSEEVLKNTLLFKPSRPLRITSFDYTNPEGLIDTYELGKYDAMKNKEKVMEFCRID